MAAANLLHQYLSNKVPALLRPAVLACISLSRLANSVQSAQLLFSLKAPSFAQLP